MNEKEYGKISFGKRSGCRRSIEKALLDLIARHGNDIRGKDQKPGSSGTEGRSETIFFQMFRQLAEMGHLFEHPDQLQESHVRILVDRWEHEGLAAVTIQHRLSAARMLARWIGKAGMVRRAKDYVHNRGDAWGGANVRPDKSWRAAGVNVDAVVAFLSSRDRHASMQLRLMADFGMPPEQAVMFKPHCADQGHYIIVRKATNRWNDERIRIETYQQRATLDAAKAMVSGVHGHVGHRGDTIEQALRQFREVLERHGITRKRLRVTLEGLRDEYYLRRAWQLIEVNQVM